MVKGTAGWEAAVAALAEHGPWPLVVVIISVVLVLNLHKIIPAIIGAWKVKQETLQKIRQADERFDLTMQERREKLTRVNPTSRKLKE